MTDAPTGKLIESLMLPAPFNVQVPPPVPEQVHVALAILGLAAVVRVASVTVALVTLLGPLFVTVIV